MYDAVKRDIQLASIPGDTDLSGCFVLSNPIGPVFIGERQGRGLGMKLEAFSEIKNLLPTVSFEKLGYSGRSKA